MTNGSASISRSLEYAVFESLVFTILTISAIAGNALVFVAVYRNPQLRKESNVYIVCLAVTDFLMGVLVLPTVDAALFTGTFPGGQSLCWFQAVTAPFLLSASVRTMVLIAVQRYYKIVRPNTYRKIFSYRFFVLSIVLIWATAPIVIGLVSLTRGRGVFLHMQFPICLLSVSKIGMFVGFYAISVILPFFVMSLLYFKIWRFLKNHNAQMNHSNVNAEEVKLTKSLCIVLGAFLICYTPFTVATGLEVKYKVQLPRELHFFALSTISFASVVNPIIYGVVNREFRKEFMKIICYSWKARFASRVEPTSQVVVGLA